MNYYQKIRVKWTLGQGIYRHNLLFSVRQTVEGIRNSYRKRKARLLIYNGIETENQPIILKGINRAIKNTFIFVLGEGWEPGIMTYEDLIHEKEREML